MHVLAGLTDRAVRSATAPKVCFISMETSPRKGKLLKSMEIVRRSGGRKKEGPPAHDEGLLVLGCRSGEMHWMVRHARREGRAGLAVLLLQPGRGDHLPDPRVDQAVDLAVEIARSLESCVRAPDVVVVKLLAGHAHLLDDILFFDPRAKDVGLVQLDHLLRLVVIDIIDDESVLVH